MFVGGGFTGGVTTSGFHLGAFQIATFERRSPERSTVALWLVRAVGEQPAGVHDFCGCAQGCWDAGEGLALINGPTQLLQDS